MSRQIQDLLQKHEGHPTDLRGEQSSGMLPSQSAGHTEGPWYVDVGADNQALHEDEPVYGAIRDEANGLHIARIWNDLDGAEANAALIARAPDLLAENSKLKRQREELVAALESIEAGLDAEIVRADGSGTHLGPLQAVASRAIVKAGGDSMHADKLKEAGS